MFYIVVFFVCVYDRTCVIANVQCVHIKAGIYVFSLLQYYSLSLKHGFTTLENCCSV